MESRENPLYETRVAALVIVISQFFEDREVFKETIIEYVRKHPGYFTELIIANPLCNQLAVDILEDMQRQVGRECDYRFRLSMLGEDPLTIREIQDYAVYPNVWSNQLDIVRTYLTNVHHCNIDVAVFQSEKDENFGPTLDGLKKEFEYCGNMTSLSVNGKKVSKEIGVPP